MSRSCQRDEQAFSDLRRALSGFTSCLNLHLKQLLCNAFYSLVSP